MVSDTLDPDDRDDHNSDRSSAHRDWSGFLLGPDFARRALGPSLDALTRSIATSSTARMTEQLGRPYRDWSRSLGVNIAKHFSEHWQPVTASLLQASSRQLAPSLAEIASSILQSTWPTNLDSVDGEIELMEQLMIDEGLPIAWVPRESTIQAIFAAETPGARRAIFGRRWKTVVDDCEQLLNQTTSVVVEPLKLQAMKSVAGLRDGHHELSQAFSAATLDTAVSTVFAERTAKKRAIDAEKYRKDLDNRPIREFFAIAQLMGVHHRYVPNEEQAIPRSFNRHASAHGVSRVQYTRLNSVLALAHLTSFLWYMELSTTKR